MLAAARQNSVNKSVKAQKTHRPTERGEISGGDDHRVGGHALSSLQLSLTRGIVQGPDSEL